MTDQLDNELFTCGCCKKQFSHIDGTWLPIGYAEPNLMKVIAGSADEPPQIFAYDLRMPEIITSDEFICYDCL